MQHKKPVIGIVGGIGAGKSLVASKFAQLGCALISPDDIAHELLREVDVMAAVGQLWGDDVLDSTGQIDRSALGEIVFDDPAEMTKLTDILHPPIRLRMMSEVTEAMSSAAAPAVVIDAAILFESGWNELCDCVVFVDAPLAVRQQRVRDHRGWDDEGLAKRERLQIGLDKKRQMCDYTVDNHASDSHLSETIRQLLERIVSTKD